MERCSIATISYHIHKHLHIDERQHLVSIGHAPRSKCSGIKGYGLMTLARHDAVYRRGRAVCYESIPASHISDYLRISVGLGFQHRRVVRRFILVWTIFAQVGS
jgi:hypothetical protein